MVRGDFDSYKSKKINLAGETQEWLAALLNTKFYTSCSDHQELQHNVRNRFCIDCKTSLCQYCLNRSSTAHRHHNTLRIRRNTFKAVVNLDDIKKFLDCSKIQIYLCNNAEAIHLNPWPFSSKPSKDSIDPACKGCERGLIPGTNNSYCSIKCKEVSVNSNEVSSPTLPVRVPESRQNEHAAMSTCTEAASLDSNSCRKPHRKRKGVRHVPCRAPFF